LNAQAFDALNAQTFGSEALSSLADGGLNFTLATAGLEASGISLMIAGFALMSDSDDPLSVMLTLYAEKY
jgi:hypothetical protein